MSLLEREPAALPGAKQGGRAGRWALAAVLLLGLAAFYLSGLHGHLSWDDVRGHLDQFQAEARRHLAVVVLAYFLTYVAATALSLPIATWLSLLGGAMLGRWLGTATVAAAATLGATLAFLSSRYLFRDFVQSRFGDRLAALNRGVERDGAYYLFTLRLVPAFPFFLINLGMGLTPLRTWTFFWVSLVGMLPGTFLYVNAGTALAAVDEPRDVLSPAVLVSLALLGVVPLALRLLVRWRVRARTVLLAVAALLLLAAAAAVLRTWTRYATADVMEIPVREFSNAEYPEDPAGRSAYHGRYNGRRLTLVRKDDTHFDFVLTAADPRVAQVAFRDVDLSLMTPSLPEWTKADDGLRRVALTDRQWNRQQVSFGRGPAHVEVTGGDGFEREHLYSAELAKNCLNAGLWEVLLFVKEGGGKALYYQGWFTFPLGHYKRLFERGTGLPYWRHWYYLEHWFDPAGTPLPLEALRRVTAERPVPAAFDGDEPVLAAGEQARKGRTTMAENVIAWKDFYDGRKVRFASFVPPGRYSVGRPWKNELWRLAHFRGAVLREVVAPSGPGKLHELELTFEGKDGAKYRFLVSGFDLAALPRLPVSRYPEGLYMPMGIGTPPFYQGYAELQKAPPQQSPYFCVLLDEGGRWVNHHEVAVDGPVLHRDEADPNKLHLYLLSYERHSLVGHFVLATGG